MWTERAFRVGAHHVTASIRVLGLDDRRLVATSMVWLAEGSASPADDNVLAWKTLFEDVLRPHLHLQVDHDEPERLDRRWWTETMRKATAAFISVNELESLIASSWSCGRPGSPPTVQ